MRISFFVGLWSRIEKIFAWLYYFYYLIFAWLYYLAKKKKCMALLGKYHASNSDTNEANLM